ncbi:hypothetical protein HK098_005067 [Nowakowskiella sp. JEL0407]|nr:hypothetical protein HK098_005067 [Nowakowskiella sp. JEL0407]
MAIGWVRTVFHDFGTYDAAAGTGGLDASILTMDEATLPDNSAVFLGGNIPFFQKMSIEHPSVSPTDWIVIGAMVALRQCGGPDLTPRFRPGRKAVYTANKNGLLPQLTQTLTELKATFTRMNLTTEQYIILTIGSHSLGGANMTVGAPGFGTRPGKSFDGTSTTFDNLIWQIANNKSTTRPLVLDSDREIMKEPIAEELAATYAADQSAFFNAYADAFMVMVDMGHPQLGCPLSGDGCTPDMMVDSPIADQLKDWPVTWMKKSVTMTGDSKNVVPQITSFMKLPKGNSDLRNIHGSWRGGCGNMAIGWVRTVFHDFATYDSVAKTGGIDASILTVTEETLPDNGAVSKGGNILFFRNQALEHPSVSASDWIVLGGIAGIRACGGPDLRNQFRPGRIDAFEPNDVTLLPDKNWSIEKLKAAFKRMNLTQSEYFTLVLGAHSLGGANMTQGSIGFETGPRFAFDSTPTKFDNGIFVKALTKPLVLASDQKILNETGGMILAKKYATSQAQFFTDFGKIFMKMVDMGHTLGCRLDGVGCTAAQMVDSSIPNPITKRPSSWGTGLNTTQFDVALVDNGAANVGTATDLPNPIDNTKSGSRHSNEITFYSFVFIVLFAIIL